jgi:hypothetical protein
LVDRDRPPNAFALARRSAIACSSRVSDVGMAGELADRADAGEVGAEGVAQHAR